MKKISVLVIIIAIICSIYFQIETTTIKKEKLEAFGVGDYIQLSNIDNTIESIPYIIRNLDKIGYEKYHENNNLTFLDGFKNGFLVIASYFRDGLVGIICGYLGGFSDKWFIVKAIWLIWGLIYIPIKVIIITFIQTGKLAFDLLIQKATLTYYVGYVLSLFISISIFFALGDDE